jgi:Tubulin like
MTRHHPTQLEAPMAAGDDLSPARGRAESRVLTPMLAIFPGTTAAHAALEFMEQARELPERDRRRIALVFIDIDHLHRDLVTFRSQHPGLFTEKVIRIAVPRHVGNIPYERQDGDEEPHTYIRGKRPDPYENGARGIRNNGHVAFCHNVAEITNGLSEVISKIRSWDSNEGLPAPRGVQVNIVSFIGGGTASGIVPDIACLARQVLDAADLDPRVNLTCILPSDAAVDDAELRRSNAVACMLEILALSMAKGEDGAPYRKYLRNRFHDLPDGPMAHEVYLVGAANMTDTRDIARVAGMDLFQRTLDASGVGALDRSEAVNRISLGSVDDRDLPTMFGTACPLEARFPVRETALAFARMAAANTLPLLIGYEPQPEPATDAERAAQDAWKRLARVDMAAGDPTAIVVPGIPRDEYEDLSELDLEPLREKLRRAEATITERIGAVVATERRRQEPRIEPEGGAAWEDRARHWQRLQREYDGALSDLGATRPQTLERLDDRERAATRAFLRDPGGLYRAHQDHLRTHAQNERRRLVEALLQELSARVRERRESMRDRAARANGAHAAAELERQARGSAAWRAQLDRPHPFQVHALDLDAMGRRAGAPSPAVELLYRWATSAISGTDETGEPDHRLFLKRVAREADIERLGDAGEQLVGTVVGFFQPLYQSELERLDLFQLFEHAAPEDRRRRGVARLVDDALSELFGRLAQRMTTDLVAFDARIGGERCVTALRTEIFVGCHTDSGADEELVKEIAIRSDILRTGGDHYRPSLDRHRLQVSYMHHAISLSTIFDFFSPVNSAMERYRRYRDAWDRSQMPGIPPPHSCTALQELVEDLDLVGKLLRTRPGLAPAPAAPGEPVRNGHGPNAGGSRRTAGTTYDPGSPLA